MTGADRELLSASDNDAVHVPDVPVALAAVAPEDTVSGAPVQGFTDLGSFAGADFGVWELRAGQVTDTEVAEISVIVAGAATIDILSGPQAGTALAVRAGDVLRLADGTRTRWTVTERIRKVYFMVSEADA